MQRSCDPYTNNRKDQEAIKWNVKELHKKPSYDKVNTLKWLKPKCSDPFVVQTKGKEECSHSRDNTVMNYATIYGVVAKVDKDLAGKCVQQGIE